jgi:hypothetical protein
MLKLIVTSTYFPIPDTNARCAGCCCRWARSVYIIMIMFLWGVHRNEIGAAGMAGREADQKHRTCAFIHIKNTRRCTHPRARRKYTSHTGVFVSPFMNTHTQSDALIFPCSDYSNIYKRRVQPNLVLMHACVCCFPVVYKRERAPFVDNMHRRQYH